VPKSLDLVRDNTELPRWMNGISSYSMWWILIHYQWFMNNGDTEYLKAQKSYLVPLVDRVIDVTLSGKKEEMGMRFLDWPTSANKPAVDAGLHALTILSLNAAEELAKYLNDENLEKKCLEAINKLKENIPDPNGSKQAAALIALAELVPATDINQKFLSKNSLDGISTFYGYYVLQARAMAGDYPGALDCIRNYWGAMLDLGATTFWENLNISDTLNASRIDQFVPPGKKDIHGDCGEYCYIGYRQSLCHGWASGPTPWLSEHVLGIKILEPGCKKIMIDPHLGDLQWVNGAYPTPYGVIKVEHTREENGKIKTFFEAPDEIEIILMAN